ncbi:MAG: PQQ-dependent sugar dehydrogenase [Nitrososphaeraceae archaeon]
MIERSNEQKERERGYKTKITLMTVILMIFTTLSLVFGLSLSSLQSQSYLPFPIPSTLLGSASVFASSQEPEFPLRYNEDLGNPVINLPGFTSEMVAEGLALPTTMAFLSQNDILVLEKDKGTVMRIIDRVVQPRPLLDVNVATEVERCMCGIAVSQNNETGTTKVFLYYTEADVLGAAIGNRVYRYELQEGASGSAGSLVNPVLLLDLPADPGPRHNGGVIKIGSDGNLYITIGDVDRIESETEAQNEPDVQADGTGGILRITQDGEPVIDPNTGDYILGSDYPLNLYYAYGIRNSFGIDFDPVSGYLWDSENGPGHSDEINRVEPGFNSGWNQIMGINTRGGGDPREGAGTAASEQGEGLVNFDGRGHYHPPQLTWLYTVGPTAIKFLNSGNYGTGYQNEMFVGDVHSGNMYHFKLNQDRTELVLEPPLDDKIADTDGESISDSALFATGFGGITDIEISPYDGYMYVVSLGQGKIFKILPTGEVPPPAPPTVVPPPPAPLPAPPAPPVAEEVVPEQEEEEEVSDENEDQGEDEDDNGDDNGDGDDDGDN